MNAECRRCSQAYAWPLPSPLFERVFSRVDEKTITEKLALDPASALMSPRKVKYRLLNADVDCRPTTIHRMLRASALRLRDRRRGELFDLLDHILHDPFACQPEGIKFDFL